MITRSNVRRRSACCVKSYKSCAAGPPAHGLHAGAAEAALRGAASLVAGHGSPMDCPWHRLTPPRDVSVRGRFPSTSPLWNCNYGSQYCIGAKERRALLNGVPEGSKSRSMLGRCWPVYQINTCDSRKPGRKPALRMLQCHKHAGPAAKLQLCLCSYLHCLQAPATGAGDQFCPCCQGARDASTRTADLEA